MTIAASQGMTCDTSLLYGHGANAFAAYPGLTRGKKANHLWLPLAVIESEDTRARLGDARTEKERLEHAVDAFARYLGQSRPDAMVSDLFHEPPTPAVVPSPTRAVVASAARTRSVTLHNQRQRETQPQELEYRLTGEQKQQLAAANGKSRMALRMAGTSRKEHRQLTQQATEQRTAGRRKGADARVAASRAAEAAWTALRTSPYAAVLGATQHQTPDVDTLAARLTEMRETLVPARDQKKISRAHGQAAKARENAAMYRAVADDARTEKVLRTRIAEQHPALHTSETAGPSRTPAGSAGPQRSYRGPEGPATRHRPRAAQARVRDAPDFTGKEGRPTS